jgi:uncharacterized protein (DUF362 family)
MTASPDRAEEVDSNVVAAVSGAASYCTTAPFHPHTRYPELPFGPAASATNAAYDSVREGFIALQWDAEHARTPEWNPLGTLVRPGDVVLLKPNLVVDRHPRDRNGLTYTITHGSVIRAVADYVTIALRGRGRIVVADAPQTDSSFEAIVDALGLRALEEFYRSYGVDFHIADLRAEEWRSEGGVIVERRALPGDPLGYTVVDLGTSSEFFGYRGENRYYGADYDTAFINEQHHGETHRYRFANTALDCDVFINMPKLKTHKKGGVTASLKNLVGINGDKNYLPHHVVGSPRDGGDQFPARRMASRVEHAGASTLRWLSLAAPAIGTRLLRAARVVGTRIFGDNRTAIRSGNWHGNDTVWRMTLDMNRVLLFWNRDRAAVDPASPRKRYLSVVDAVIAGEGNGPMDPDPRPLGTILIGTNPAAVDATAAVLMGFDPDKIPTIREAFSTHVFPVATGDWRDVEVSSNRPEWSGLLGDIDPEAVTAFVPHFGWRGYIERTVAATATR